MNPATGWRTAAVFPAAVLVCLVACQKVAPVADKSSAPASDTADKHETAEASEDGLSLKPVEVEKMGVATSEAQTITSAPEVSGFGVVLAHEPIAQAVAELRTARAAERQSRAALERSKRLAGTPGAFPAEVQETAERQALADQAALSLSRQRLSSTFGQNPPWKLPEDSRELSALAAGESKLVRVTFPLGALGDTVPGSVRLSRIDASHQDGRWLAHSVWRAPADSTVPGRSFFAILPKSDASEGDHLLAWVPVGTPEPGVLVPAAAAVISAGKFWCYVEERPNTFVRHEFDPGRPVSGGYFVKQGISAGEKIVTSAAGQLLARESDPSTEAE